MTKPLPIDHYALRVLDRYAALPSYTRAGYEVVDSFDLTLEDGSTARSYALSSPYGPDVFISSGPPDSLIWNWVQEHGGQGGLHHVAYEVGDVAAKMTEWRKLGVEFKELLVCSCEQALVQVFTEPDPATGMITELITRNGHPGFCEENVRRLMALTAD